MNRNSMINLSISNHKSMQQYVPLMNNNLNRDNIKTSLFTSFYLPSKLREVREFCMGKTVSSTADREKCGY